jgi:glycerol-3-phosphate dehydrogenase (NAD(P)+)
MNVTVLGAGSWGTTVASLTTALNPTVLWARNPAVAEEVNDSHSNSTYLPSASLPRRLRATCEMEEAVRDADVLIVGVPSKGFRATVEEARQWIRPWVPVVSLTKGLEGGTLKRMTEVIEELLPGHPAAALSGPNLAREIMAGQAAASVIATDDMGVAAALQKVLQHKLFRVYRNHDVIGCEIGGALKNVIAIAAGIGEGLGVGDNTRSAVMTRGLAELTRLGVAMGAESQTLSGLAGMGDLMATCMSPYSRNRTVGEMLGRGKNLEEILAEMHMVAEGVGTARLALSLAATYGVDLPICQEIHEVVTGRQRPVDAYRGLRVPGHESDPG